jgi:F-type H+-transporting ATPase subunit b
MNAFALLAELQGGGQPETIRQVFGVDWPHLLAQSISFFIVCVLLYRWAYKPILGMLEARRQKIAEGLTNAEKIKAELRETESQRHEFIQKATAEANQIVEEAHAAAARVQQRETEKALAAAEQIVAKSREDAAREHTRMLAGLKGEVGRLVVETTAAVTGKILTPEDQRRLAEETTKQLPS